MESEFTKAVEEQFRGVTALSMSTANSLVLCLLLLGLLLALLQTTSPIW